MQTCSRVAMAGMLITLGLASVNFVCSRPVKASTSATATIAIDPPIVLNGGVVRVEWKSDTDPKIKGEFEGKKFPLYWDAKTKLATGYFGVPHDRKPGPAKVQIDGKTVALEIKDANYPLEHLKVDPKHVNPPKKEMARIQREIKKVSRIFNLQTPEKFWSGEFVVPMQSGFTSLYGGRRMYNGEERNFHGGLDFKAAVGTPVYATQDGVVELSEDLYFTGHTLMIDHGMGIVTMVAHLSKREVKAGQKIKKGQLLGLSGATGRVSGPHLHWQIYVQSVKVNPQEFLKIVR